MLTLNIEDVEKLSIELSQMVETVPELVAYVCKRIVFNWTDTCFGYLLKSTIVRN